MLRCSENHYISNNSQSSNSYFWREAQFTPVGFYSILTLEQRVIVGFFITVQSIVLLTPAGSTCSQQQKLWWTHHESLNSKWIQEHGHQNSKCTPGEANQLRRRCSFWLLACFVHLALFRWVIVVRFITEVSCWLIMRSGFNWPHHSLAFLRCLGSSWLKARCRYDCSGCVIVSHGSGLWVNLLRGSLLDSSTF